MIVSLDLQGDIVALAVGARHVELQQHNEVRRHHGSELQERTRQSVDLTVSYLVNQLRLRKNFQLKFSLSSSVSVYRLED